MPDPQKKPNLLDQVNRKSENFVFSVCHNLRSPLASIRGIADIISSEELQQDDFVMLMAELITSIDRMDQTICETIDYSKKSDLNITPAIVDVAQLIHSSFRELKFCTKNKVEMTLTSNIESAFYSDVKCLNSLVTNVMSNAIKYADEAKDTSFLSIDLLVNENMCIIKFEDNGIGMSDDTISKACDMFYRGTNKAFGTGMGLAIAKETIDQLGGIMNIDSKSGIGTTITLKIPNMNKCTVHP